MQWLNDPPCNEMKLELFDPGAGRLELSGPTTSERVNAGVVAALGATFTSATLPFLRAPIPMPFKLVPAVFGLVGTGLGALGLANATGQASVSFERGKGVRFRWKLGPMRPRELLIPTQDIADFELTFTEQRDTNSRGFSTGTSYTYFLNLVTKAGKAIAVEHFPLRAQAQLRKEQAERVLGLGRHEPKSPPRTTSRTTGGRRATGVSRRRGTSRSR